MSILNTRKHSLTPPGLDELSLLTDLSPHRRAVSVPGKRARVIIVTTYIKIELNRVNRIQDHHIEGSTCLPMVWRRERTGLSHCTVRSPTYVYEGHE